MRSSQTQVLLYCKYPGKCHQTLHCRCGPCEKAARAKAEAAKAVEKARMQERIETRKLMRSMPPDERAKFQLTQQQAVTARLDANNASMLGDSKASFLTLPPEIRERIYDLIWDRVTSYLISTVKQCDGPRDVKLHQVCVQLKHEIPHYFFGRQQFCFTTKLAMEIWARKHPDRLSQMRHVATCFTDPSPFVQFANSFQAVRSLIVQGYGACRLSYGKVRYPQLDIDYAIAWRQLEIIVTALPQFQTGVIEESGNVRRNWSRHVRFRLDDPLPSPQRSARWLEIDMAVVSGNITWFARLLEKEQRPLPEKINGVKYTSWRDFIQRGLARKTKLLPSTASKANTPKKALRFST